MAVQDLASFALSLILFILPSYFANSTPVLLGGGTPLDLGKKLSDGQRAFGNGKTIRGFFAGIFAALLVGVVEALVLPGTPYDLYSSASTYVLAALLLGFGTMAGDVAGSFIKRRQKVSQGKPSLLMDQLMFLFFALLFSYPLSSHLLSLEAVAFLAVLTYFVHVGANIIAHYWGLKKVPW